LNQSYIANGIAKATAQAKANGKSDEVAALNAEKAAVEKGAGVPAEDASDVPESLKTLRNTYRAALATIEADRTKAAAPLYDIYLKALDAYVIELTRADKIKEAQEVQLPALASCLPPRNKICYFFIGFSQPLQFS
jgi:hypothetical protein